MKSIQSVAAVHGIKPLVFGADQQHLPVRNQAEGKPMKYGQKQHLGLLQRGRTVLTFLNPEIDGSLNSAYSINTLPIQL